MSRCIVTAVTEDNQMCVQHQKQVVEAPAHLCICLSVSDKRNLPKSCTISEDKQICHARDVVHITMI